MEQIYYTKLAEGRRIAIPAEVCKELGLQAGDSLAIKVGHEGLQVLTHQQIIREVQAAFAPYARHGVDEVDELIRERREEAFQEDRAADGTANHGNDCDSSGT